MANAGTVTIHLDAQSVKLIRELQKAQRQTQRSARGMQKSMTGAFNRIRTGALAAAAAFGLFGAARTIKGIAQAGLAMERMERSLKFATGSAMAAKDEMAFLRAESERLGLNLEVTASAYVKLAAAAQGTALQGQETRNIFVSISEATRVLGLTADATGSILTAIEQMISKGKVSAEELRKQMQQLPGAFNIAARSIGVTTTELDKMLSAGKLMATDFLPSFAREIQATFGGQVTEAANDAQGAFNRFETSIFELKAALAGSGLLDLLASMAGHLTTSATAVGGFLTTTLEERVEQIKKEVAELVDLRDRKLTGKTRRAELNEQINTLAQELSLTQDRLAIEARVTEERRRQRDMLEEIIVTMKSPSFQPSDFLQELSIESGLDRVLRPEVREDVEQLQRSFSLVTKAAKETKVEITEVDQVAQDLGFTFASAFEDAILEAKKLSEVLKSLLKDIARIILRRGVIEPLAGAITGGFGKLFGGARAEGGPVMSGGSYLVGEKGPELFSPAASGFITPNAALGLSGSPVINYTIDARGVDEQRIMQRLAPMLEQTVQATRALVRRDQLEGSL